MKNYLFKDKVGENLLTFLRLKGYTKTSLSKLTGISRPTINQILEGKSPNDNIYEEQINKISKALDLPENYFIEFSAIPQEKWQSSSTQYSDRISGSDRTQLAQDLLEDLDELLTVSAFYIKG